MEGLIRQAFLHVDVIGPHVNEGHYDLLGPDGEIILPQVWETMIQPDWIITMHMWPMPEPPAPPFESTPPPTPPRPRSSMFPPVPPTSSKRKSASSRKRMPHKDPPAQEEKEDTLRDDTNINSDVGVEDMRNKSQSKNNQDGDEWDRVEVPPTESSDDSPIIPPTSKKDDYISESTEQEDRSHVETTHQPTVEEIPTSP